MLDEEERGTRMKKGRTRRKEGRGGRSDEESEEMKKLLKKKKKMKKSLEYASLNARSFFGNLEFQFSSSIFAVLSFLGYRLEPV